MGLTDEERRAIVTYRLEKSFDTLKEARAVAKLNFWSLCANRLYYSAYYACVALLISNGLEANSHAGVTHLIGLHFVKTGILTTEDSRLLKNLYMMRQSGDYDDLFDWKESDILPLISITEAFVEKISKLTSGQNDCD